MRPGGCCRLILTDLLGCHQQRRRSRIKLAGGPARAHRYSSVVLLFAGPCHHGPWYVILRAILCHACAMIHQAAVLAEREAATRRACCAGGVYEAPGGAANWFGGTRGNAGSECTWNLGRTGCTVPQQPASQLASSWAGGRALTPKFTTLPAASLFYACEHVLSGQTCR